MALPQTRLSPVGIANPKIQGLETNLGTLRVYVLFNKLYSHLAPSTKSLNPGQPSIRCFLLGVYWWSVRNE
jgi:hypothetical protein